MPVRKSEGAALSGMHFKFLTKSAYQWAVKQYLFSVKPFSCEKARCSDDKELFLIDGRDIFLKRHSH